MAMSDPELPQDPARTADRPAPEARLEAIVGARNRERAREKLTRICRRLNRDPEGVSTWLDAARDLRARGIISEDVWHYLAEAFIQCLVDFASEHDPELKRLSRGMAANRGATGPRPALYLVKDNAPVDREAITAAEERREEEIVISYLRRFRHAEVAELREKDLSMFYTRVTNGSEEFGGLAG